MKIILFLTKYKKYQQQQKCLPVVDGLDTWLASLVMGLTSANEMPTVSDSRH
jgi:hypothetical protein